VHNLFFTFTGTGSSLFDLDSWRFTETPTTVSETRNDTHKQDQAVYDLRGQRVNDNSGTKSVKIVGGRKILK
jgi:hypothetical protein